MEGLAEPWGRQPTPASRKWPTLGSLTQQVNFILFICIIRILVQKLRPPDVGKNDSSPYS